MVEWSIESLKAYFDMRLTERDQWINAKFIDQKEAVDAALASADRAVQKAETTSETRFAGINEFRSTLSDQQKMLMTRTEYDSNHKSLVEKIDGVSSRLDKMDGKSSGTNAIWLIFVSIVGLVLGIIGTL